MSDPTNVSELARETIEYLPEAFHLGQWEIDELEKAFQSALSKLAAEKDEENAIEREAKLEYLRRDAERNRQLVAEREARVKAERERDDIRETMRQCEGPQGWVKARHEDYIYLFNGREKLRAHLQEMTRQYGLMCTLRENAQAERDELRAQLAKATQQDAVRLSADTAQAAQNNPEFASALGAVVEHVRSSALIDQLDLNRDEFLRIKALCANHPEDVRFGEIAGLCDRAQQSITQNVPVIRQRNELESDRDTLRAKLTSMEQERDEAHTDRARFEQSVESLTVQLDALRATKDKSSYATGMRNADLARIEELAAEVERLTKEQDEALQKAVERDEDQQDAIIEQEKEIAELNSELATLRATREQDHGAAIESASEDCAKNLKLTFPQECTLARHMRALVATVTNSQQKPHA